MNIVLKTVHQFASDVKKCLNLVIFTVIKYDFNLYSILSHSKFLIFPSDDGLNFEVLIFFYKKQENGDSMEKNL